MTFSSAIKITELVDIDTLLYTLRTDSTLSLEQASIKLLLQDSAPEAVLATIIFTMK